MTARKIYAVNVGLTEDNEATPEWMNEPQGEIERGRHPSPFEPNPTALGTGFAATLPKPEFRFDRDFGASEPFDAYQCSPYWLVSRRLKDALLSIEPTAFDAVQTISRLPSQIDAPEYWLIELVQFCDCLDEERSRSAGALLGWPDRSINLVPENRDRVFFDGSALGARSFFKLRDQFLACLCTEDAKRALEAAAFTNLRFDGVGSII